MSPLRSEVMTSEHPGTPGTEAMGPVDFVLMEFPDQEPRGEVANALLDLVERNTIKLYDIAVIRKATDGNVAAVELSDLGDTGFSPFLGARSGLLGEDDLAEAAVAMEPGTVALLIVYENAWAAPFIAAAQGAGGQLAASARIPVQNIIDALDALDGEE